MAISESDFPQEYIYENLIRITIQKAERPWRLLFVKG